MLSADRCMLVTYIETPMNTAIKKIKIGKGGGGGVAVGRFLHVFSL